MASLQTKIQIWNMALDHLREQPLASPDAGVATSKWLTRNYDQQRDYLMGRYFWKFALARDQLAADETAPAWRWSYRYQIPTDSIRIIPPTYNGEWNGTPIPYEVEQDFILCDQEAPLRLRYVKRITNEGTFTNGFCELLCLRLARRMAHWMTGKASMIKEIDALYKEAYAEVITEETVQVAQDDYYDTDILGQRLT